MEWVQFVIFFIGVFGLFIWNRAESRSDIRHMDAKLEGQRNLMNAIHDEVKDFHAKLQMQDKDFRSTLQMQEKDFYTKLQMQEKDFHEKLLRQDLEFKQQFLELEKSRLK